MRKVFAATLVVGMAFAGTPVGAFTAPAAGNTMQGPQNPPGTGGVQGVAKDAQQQNLPGVRVQVRAANGQLAATGTTNAAGEFVFTGLNPAAYTIEIVNAAGDIVGIATVTVGAGATASVALTASAVGALTAPAGTAGGLSLLGLGTLGTAGVLGAAGAVAIVAVETSKKDASPSR